MSGKDEFETRWPGLETEINDAVTDMIARGFDAQGIGIGLLLAGIQTLVVINGPQAALAALNGMRGRLCNLHPEVEAALDSARVRNGFATKH